jgi:POT family proton-dependent oligopeptide transporter
VALAKRLREVRDGFHRSFWVANGMELFERLAYYGQGTILSIFLRNHLHFTEVDAGAISSIFGGLIYFLPIFAGTIADKIGFRRSFAIAFSVLAIGYFLIGSTGMHAFEGAFTGLPLFWVLIPFVIFTAMGGAFIKPSVLGTVAVTSKPETKSLGYAVYYWLVNIGALLGPVLANLVRREFGIEFVYLVSATSCALMLAVNLAFYKDVEDAGGRVVETMGTKMKNLVVVLGNGRFITFLLIFSLYWIMFWGGLYIVMPFYLTDFIDKDANFELIIATGAAAIIVLQLVVNRLTKGLSPSAAILSGFAISSLCWLIIAFHPSIPVIVAGITVWSIGEMTQAPRYYEYISGLAPKGQQALFQGYAFLPIAIAWAVGGTFGGWLYSTYALEGSNPGMVWIVLLGVGVLATVLMWIYNMTLGRRRTRPEIAP